MVESIVYMTVSMCITLIILMSMYTERSYNAVKNWKGRYLTLSREIKKYEKEVQQKLTDIQRTSVLDKLNIPEDLADEVIDFLDSYGIPESAVNALIDNPKLIEGLLSKVKDRSTSTTGI